MCYRDAACWFETLFTKPAGRNSESARAYARPIAAATPATAGAAPAAAMPKGGEAKLSHRFPPYKGVAI